MRIWVETYDDDEIAPVCVRFDSRGFRITRAEAERLLANLAAALELPGVGAILGDHAVGIEHASSGLDILAIGAEFVHIPRHVDDHVGRQSGDDALLRADDALGRVDAGRFHDHRVRVAAVGQIDGSGGGIGTGAASESNHGSDGES